MNRGDLVDGERVLLTDRKGRRHLVRLSEGGEFHTHSGVVLHDEILGQEPGRTVRSTKGAAYVVMRPTMADTVLEMPRGAQVIYPKDLGAILLVADIFPGARVLEAGLGSGALSMAMLRAGVEICGVEVREDFESRARRNVAEALGDEALERYRTTVGDVYEGIEATDLDRVVLDLPEPWRVVPHAEEAMAPGGLLLAYTPSILQAQQTRTAFEERGRWTMARTTETLVRGWHIEGASVRPDHRMVAHTGFLTVARLLAAGEGGAGSAAPETAPTGRGEGRSLP